MTTASGGEAWRFAAACAGLGPAMFYDPVPSSVRAAKAVCAQCPVVTDCASHAMANREPFGIWGGQTETERAEASARRVCGPSPAISDTELAALLARADPQVLAIEVIRRRFELKPDAAYKYLTRARRLGLVERRGRNLYPAGPATQV